MCKLVVWNLECIFPWEQYYKWRLGAEAGGWRLMCPTAYAQSTRSSSLHQGSDSRVAYPLPGRLGLPKAKVFLSGVWYGLEGDLT